MMRDRLLSIRRFHLAGIALIAATASCVTDASSPTLVAPDRISFGKSTAELSISSVTPDSASQDTTLDVVINGNGFASGAVATWSLAGVADSTQVRTNRTQFVSSKKLIANITISSSATIAKWDIVLRVGGKGGIGTEAFAIKPKRVSDTNSRLNYVIASSVDVGSPGLPSNVQPSGIRGDGRLRDGSSANGGDSEYQSAFCAATGSLVTMPEPNGSPGTGNLSYQPGNGNYPCGARRYISFNLDGVWINADPLSRIPAVGKIPVGGSVVTTEGIGIDIPNCQVLKFDPAYGGDNIVVTRLDDGTGPRRWIMRSAGTHMAACTVLGKKGAVTWVPTGEKHYLPFSMTFTEVPYPWPVYPGF